MRLDSREISVEIETSRFRLDINVQTKKSQSRSRNSSRSENFGVSQQFVSISIKKCMDFCIFSSRFLDKSRLHLDKSRLRLDKSRQSWQISTISMCLDDIDKNLDATKSWLKSLDFKNLDREKKKVYLDRQENLDNLKKLVSIEISRSRLRILDFVSTSMSTKSLNRDREIHRDLKILAFLNSLSQSQWRSAWIFVFSHRDSSFRRDFSSFSDSKGLDKSRLHLDKSRQSWRVSTISTKILTRQSLDWKVSILKILTKKKKSWSRPSRKSRHFKKVGLDTKDVLDLDLDWSRLSRPPGLFFILWKKIIITWKNIYIISKQSGLSKTFQKQTLRTSKVKFVIIRYV